MNINNGNEENSAVPCGTNANSAGQAATCGGRREFLVRASATAGGLVLGLTSLRTTQAQEAQQPQPDGGAATPTEVGANEIVLKLNGDSPLAKVGGSQTVETSQGKIVVARTGETSFVAVSAICTHRNGPIIYDAAAKQFHCPWHNSRFDLDGKVVRPPARRPLPAFATQNAAVVSLQPITPQPQ